MLNHLSFNTKIAKEYGINNAVIMEVHAKLVDYYRIMYRGDSNDIISTQVRYSENRYWVSSSLSGFCSLIYYLSEKELNNILFDCQQKGILILQQRLDSNDYVWDGNKLWIAIGDYSPYSYLNKYQDNTPNNPDRFAGNKNFIHKRDGGKCCICGATNRLAVHHIDGYFEDKPENNKANKLILVCNSCHRKIHGKKNPLKIPKEELERIGYFDKEWYKCQ